MKNIWDVDTKVLVGYSNEPKSEWREQEESVTVIASSLEQAIEKTKKYKSEEWNGSFKDEDTKENVKYWVERVRVVGAKHAGTIEIL